MSDADRVERWLAEARKALQARRPKQVIKAAKQVLAVEPHHPAALFMTGMAEDARGRRDVAINFLELAAQADPNQPQIHFNLGVLYGLSGRTIEAERVFGGMARHFPEDLNILANLGRAQYANRKWREAAATLDKVSRKTPGHHGVWEQLGAARQQAGEDEGAAKAYRTAIAISGDNADVHANLGIVLLRLEKLQEARDAFVKALELAPEHDLARRRLSEMDGPLS